MALQDELIYYGVLRYLREQGSPIEPPKVALFNLVREQKEDGAEGPIKIQAWGYPGIKEPTLADLQRIGRPAIVQEKRVFENLLTLQRQRVLALSGAQALELPLASVPIGAQVVVGNRLYIRVQDGWGQVQLNAVNI